MIIELDESRESYTSMPFLVGQKCWTTWTLMQKTANKRKKWTKTQILT